MAASTPPRKRAPRTTARAQKTSPATPPPTAIGEAPTSVSAWRKGTQGEDLRVPSGNVCRVRRVAMHEWLREGIVPDTLRPIIDRAIAQGQGQNMKKFEAELQAAATDPAKIADMFDMMDRVVALVVSEPPVVFHKRLVKHVPPAEDEWEIIPDGERAEDRLYTDEIQDEDKFFLFNFAVGGVRDLERFRQEFGSGLAALQSG